MVMPAMSGRELAEHIRRLSAETPILCTSGFVRSTNLDDALSYLQKPFTSQELLLKVRSILSGGAGGGGLIP
jgi:CheY-like chemotaxis protein